jgi:hypothetical protein
MNKCFGIILLLISATVFAAPLPISSKDAGTFVVLDKERKPSKLFYRLSLGGSAWKMEGKKASGGWDNISCEKSCQYKPTPSQDAASYLPIAMRQSYDIACIQNIAQAFCRYSLKSNASQGGYVVVALVTGQARPILVQRVANE